MVERGEEPFQGPVVGIYYGLKSATSDNCCFTSFDALFLNLRLMASSAWRRQSSLFFLAESLAALAPCIPQIGQALKAATRRGQIMADFFYEQVKARFITEAEGRVWDLEGLAPSIRTRPRITNRHCADGNVSVISRRDLSMIYVRSHLSSVDFSGA